MPLDISGGDRQEPAALADARMAVQAFRVCGQGFDHDVAMAQNGPRRSGYRTDARYPSGGADGRRLAEQAEGSEVSLRVERLAGAARSLVDAHRAKPNPLPGRSPNYALGRSLFTGVRGRGFLRSLLRPEQALR